MTVANWTTPRIDHILTFGILIADLGIFEAFGCPGAGRGAAA
jgi:hypothetical protein